MRVHCKRCAQKSAKERARKSRRWVHSPRGDVSPRLIAPYRPAVKEELAEPRANVVRQLKAEGWGPSQIARKLGISRASIHRTLEGH